MQAIKKKFNKKQTARLKPNTDETNSAIEALAGFLTDPEYTDESRSFVSGDLELDAGILSSGDFAAPPAATQNKNRHHHQDTSADFADNDEDGENLVPRERPKRKSAIEAQSRLQKQKEEEAAERLRKERRRAQLFTHTPQSASASATTSSYPHPASASSDDAATPLPPAHSSNHNNNSSNSNSPPSAAFLPSSAGISSLATGSASRCEPMFSTSPFASSSSPSKGPAIENIIRSLDMQENDAIPSEVLNDVFMDPMGSADTVSPFVYDPTTRHIMYQGNNDDGDEADSAAASFPFFPSLLPVCYFACSLSLSLPLSLPSCKFFPDEACGAVSAEVFCTLSILASLRSPEFAGFCQPNYSFVC